MDDNGKIQELKQIRVVGIKRLSNKGSYYGLLLQEMDGDRSLQIVIGASEAQSIECGLRHLTPPRPLTHDLISNLFDCYGLELTGVVIDQLPEGVFCGTLLVRQPWKDENKTMDARSSDAVAIAIRRKAPIYIPEKLLDQIGVPTSDWNSNPNISERDENVSEDCFNVLEDISNDITLMSLQQLQKNLEQAIVKEKYEEAARIKSEINRRFPDSQTSEK